MIISVINFIMASILICILMFVGLMVGFRSDQDRDKCSPFECGFDPKNSARISFSLRFFLLAVIFLIFDIEIVFLFPIPFMIMKGFMNSMYIYSFLALLILLIGLFHEWREGSLDWSL